MKAIIYDIEIIKAVPPYGNEPLQNDIDYCAGWQDHKNMGISVVGCYDYAESRYRVFCADNFGEFIALFERSELAVGFNNIGFDDQVLGSNVSEIKTPRYDLLSETWVAAGLAPKWGKAATHGGYGLDAICKATFNEGKTGDGANAAIAWQRGKIGTVIDYCLQDIRLTKKLFDYAFTGNSIVDPKTGKSLILRAPTELNECVVF